MSADHLLGLALALTDATVGLAGGALVAALALIAFARARAARTTDLAPYQIIASPDTPPAPELLFTHLHALLSGPQRNVLARRSVVVLIARGTAAGLRLGVAIDARDVRRVQAGLETLWPGTRLAATFPPPTNSVVALEWSPRVDSAAHTSSLPGAAVALARALTHAETGEELSLQLALWPDEAEQRSLLSDFFRRAESAGDTQRRKPDEARRVSSRRDAPFVCRVAITARAKSDSRARSLIRELEASVRVLCAGSGIRLQSARLRKTIQVSRPFAVDNRRLTPSELAVLFPLAPIAALAAKASSHETEHGERLLGARTETTSDVEVRLSLAESQHHLHLLGPTGTGKSTLLLNLAAQDIAAGRGCAVLDPKGDLIRDLLLRIPRGRVADVVYLGPSEGARAVGINPLTLGVDEDPTLAAENVLSIFKRIYEDNWGPRTDDVLKSCLLTLVAVPGSTLAHIPAMLADRALRRRLTVHVDDAIGVGGFWRWYERVSEAKRLEVTAPLLNKLRDFLLRPRLRHLLCQPRSTVDLRALIERGGILLADLGVGRWGESASALAGSFLVARLWQAALSRQSVSEERRRDFLLYIDEFQSFLGIGGPFADALAQARALRLSLTIANQHLGQLPREIREAVAANARSRIAFRCAAAEATAIAAEFAPLESAALVALRPFEAAVRLVSTRGAFAMRTLPPLSRPADAADPAEVLAMSAAQFGYDVDSIDAALRELAGEDDTPEEPSRERSSP